MKLLEIPVHTAADEIDEEILEIFVEEVQEVLEEIVSSFAQWKQNPNDVEALQTLRRAFHTLKGSGRLVGATIIGELGWRFESMLNRIIDGSMPINDNVFSLIGQVDGVIPGLIEEFQQQASTTYRVLLLISQADYLTETKGESIGDFEVPADLDATISEETATAPVKESASVETPTPEAIAEPEPIITEDVSLNEDLSLDTDSSDDLDLSNFDDDLTLSDDLDDSALLDDMALDSDLGDLDTSLDDSSLGDLDTDLDDSTTLGELDTSLDDSALGDLDTTLDESDLLSDDDELLPLGGDLATDEEEESVDPALLDIFTSEAQQHIANLRNLLADYEQHEEPQLLTDDVIRCFHTLNGSSRSVSFTEVFTLAGPLENYSRVLSERKVNVSDDTINLFKQAVDMMDNLLKGEIVDDDHHSGLISQIAMAEARVPAPKPEPKPAAPEPTFNTGGGESFTAPDPTDEFMAIFLEEAEEILENTQSLLERWQTAPDNMQLMKELQRELHTLKGGARMVEITPMGDLSHQLESVLTKIVEGTGQSSQRIQDVIQTCVDELVAMLEAVRSSLPLNMPDELIGKIKAAVSGGTEPETPEPTKAVEKTEPVKPAPKSQITEAAERDKAIEKEKEPEMTESGAEDRIRVRVALIEKLTGLAGELSISRAHMEQQQGSFKANLGEMEQTVTRLRDQLRRLEIETEAQILSSFRETVVEEDDEEFDPLEMDRFSVMQQLSRSLAESVNDLLNIQDYLKVLTRQSDTLLVQQTRIGTELQDVIMRTRMIPFSRISPRLQRIARLTSRELRKQMNFEIIGETIEFERTVLNRIVAPLEHMLRNAIGHGVEDSATRQQSGKPAAATVKIKLSKEGTDLIIRLSDDGAGLNLQAIRKKAEDRGMVKAGTVVSDKELMQFILEPSFSTAQSVTQISGRGVGMDVVNTEIKQLGGALQIHSKTGQGTTFEIRLPLSLTINQALLVHVNEETMAVPLNHVEAVLRIPRQQANTEEPSYYKYMEHDYRIFYLGDILGFSKPTGMESPLIPTLLIRSGDRRVALLVDGIEGSKEVVVKPVGPQIGSIKWLAGATILGDGRVVLILDVPTLTRIEEAPQYETLEEEVEEEIPTTIMVVDDSITVRKVTARLLKRQGMEVLTAKDGVDAVAQLQDHIPDLMLLDVEMPRMDGYELATQVRNNPELKHIPIIMITSRTGAKHRDRAEKIGINRYLGKPFNETELLENINALLDERQIEAA
ncbi:Hpt domain-containing protein [Candidatus Albibeggiatoa sp. nov. NOAA]|uniref:Hpt domain-containing protein n=1 Tax=Candidatus Albibeggiatoa sp. nov. NOAA TaxID=3162724 RepID=UPI0032FB3B19|nr:Hpt domain-containing protein [Thiotrichaceae bacterium]